ncbi:enoyl-CoA hydratase/isomerase family protein [Miltoncostaea marina]|uniref:enoyl-CoA hydratase/isomerase family protein n=1 Tax=Miltoncostaea marina TaxID=2843215 RepID=UPI001C3E5115|nr:enoyl-CoA hydratase-related protein [Miltoncostaea marina]
MPAEAPPSGGRLLVEEDGDALVVRIANEARANALDERILEDLVSLLGGPRPAAVRVVLLGGAGDRHFSAGLDLGDRPADELVAHLQAGERLLGRAARAIADCPRPVIGVLNGAALGGALELAMACDWRVARRGARLGVPAARLGVVYSPDGLRRFVAAMGPARTKRLFLTGRPVEADEALALGLVDEVAADDAALWAAARAAAADVAAGAPLAVEGTRAIIAAIGEGAPWEVIEETAAPARSRAFGSDDFKEGLAAFRERRAPRFRGR